MPNGASVGMSCSVSPTFSVTVPLRFSVTPVGLTPSGYTSAFQSTLVITRTACLRCRGGSTPQPATSAAASRITGMSHLPLICVA